MHNRLDAPRQPSRLRVRDELGLLKTPMDDHDLTRRDPAAPWLVLGLGADPAVLKAELPEAAEVFYLECPAFLEQAGADYARRIPPGWRRIEAADPAWTGNLAVSKGAVRLFPAFWTPVLAALALPRPDALPRAPGRTAFLPGGPGRLLTAELAEGLAACGLTMVPPDGEDLAQALKRHRPDLFVSVNFQGLDDYGVHHALLARAGVPVAVWCVDNPFHCLSRLKGAFWRDIPLFVTDDWFIAPLQEHGARRVFHLPLAASPGFFRAGPAFPELADRLLFVGRSEFPDKRNFFAGLKPPPDLWQQSQEMLLRGERPDFAWWTERLALSRLWPGKEVRLAGLGAEECGRAWRRLLLTAVAEADASQAGRPAPSLVVHGDEGWRDLVAGAFDLRGPVDYYGPLAGMYASALAVLNATSPLLPRGLTQRHFDVWAAGGLLLTDDTPGLDLFPAELRREVVFRTASDIPALAARHRSDPALRARTIAAWRDLMAREHTYPVRARTLLEHMGLDLDGCST